MVIQAESTRLTTGGTADLSLHCLGYHCTRAACLAPWDMIMAETKKCTKCGETKPFSEFNRHSSGKYGLRPRCKKCLAALRIVYYAANREKVAIKHREYYAKNREKIKARVRKYSCQHREDLSEKRREYRASDPIRRFAHDIVSEARRRGELTPCSCENCGSTNKTEAHHGDYSKPLDVQWLCRSCHMRLHGETRRKEA